jgi:L-alanine-DL-glutamate epimerase-like enolase superfamily enzyme
MKITEVDVYLLTAPEDDRPHWVSHFVVPTANDLLVRLKTDAGLEGFGLASSNTHLDGAASRADPQPGIGRVNERAILDRNQALGGARLAYALTRYLPTPRL